MICLQIPFSFAVELWGEGDNGQAKCFDLFNPDNIILQVTRVEPGLLELSYIASLKTIIYEYTERREMFVLIVFCARF